MQKLLSFLVFIICALHTSAFNIESGKKYRIVCEAFPQGSLCLGANHGSQYPLYHPANYNADDANFADAFWTLTANNDGSYTVRHALTGQYITWTSSNMGLTLSNSNSGSQRNWFFKEESDNAFRIYTNYYRSNFSKKNYWNLRNTTSNTPYVLGTYTYETASNSLFHLVSEEESGNGGGEGGGDNGSETTPTYTVVDGGSDAYVIRQTGRRLTVIPRCYVNHYDYSGNTINFDLINGERLVFDQTTEGNLNLFPDDEEYPAFTSYKFNNKFNYQLPVDAEAASPGDAEFSLSVGGIGKWLTASFQLSDPDAVAYIGEVRQESKVTRQRFDTPMTYTVGFKTWRKVELRNYSAITGKDAGTDADIRTAYVPYGRQQTVSIDWLTDHPTGQYGIPRIDITLTDHPNAQWGSSWYDPDSYYWIGQDGKETYIPASIEIDGASVYPDMQATPILIKGRGNTTWSNSYQSKNPYHFKFEKGQKPLGLTKGKHWVLLSNKQIGSMTSNAVGQRVAGMMDCSFPCHIIPVELYINGSYRGSYNLSEKVGLAGNSVDLDDETYAALLELDSQTNEPSVPDNYYSLPTKIKDPDFEEKDEWGNLTYTGPLDAERDVLGDWNKFLGLVKNGEDFTPYVDIEHLTAFLCANELIAKRELRNPRSIFVYSENVTDGFNIETSRDDTPWVFGPLWDCDWDFGYEYSGKYFQIEQTGDYFNTLLADGHSQGRAKQMWNVLRHHAKVDELYYYKWHDFYYNKLPELLDFCDEYYAFVKRSFAHNQQAEGTDGGGNRDYTDYAATTANAKKWLKQRADYIFASLKTYPLPTVEPEPEPTYSDADALPTGNLFPPATIGTLAKTIERIIKGEATINDVNNIKKQILQQQ